MNKDTKLIFEAYNKQINSEVGSINESFNLPVDENGRTVYNNWYFRDSGDGRTFMSGMQLPRDTDNIVRNKKFVNCIFHPECRANFENCEMIDCDCLGREAKPEHFNPHTVSETHKTKNLQLLNELGGGWCSTHKIPYNVVTGCPECSKADEEVNNNLVSQYVEIGYKPYHDNTQADAAKSYPECQQCKSTNTEYVGLQKTKLSGGKSIISIIRCNDCGHQEEF